MIRKTLIALTAASALAIGFGATSAKADSLDFGLGFGPGGVTSGSIGIHSGGYGGGYGGGYYDAGYDDSYDNSDCRYVMVKRKHWNWNHTYKITTWSKQMVCY